MTDTPDSAEAVFGALRAYAEMVARERDALRAEVARLRIEMDAAERFGGGWFADVVSEDTREVYRGKARDALAQKGQTDD